MPPPKRPVRAPPPDAWTPRARGALLGLAVGDALGTTMRGKRFVSPPFADLVRGHQELEGRGPWKVQPGQVTEPTQLAAVLAAGLSELGSYNPEDALRRYRRWRQTTSAPSEEMAKVLDVAMPAPGRQAWIDSARKLSGPGALTRAVPLAVFLSGQGVDAAAQGAMTDVALTHFHPRCQLAQVALTAALVHALAAPPGAVGLDRLFEVIDEALVLATERLLRELPIWAAEVHAALGEVRLSLQLARTRDPELYGPTLHLFRNTDLVDVPFRLAFFQLAQGRSLEEALVDVVNRGGDADLNAALAGALLGAVQGEAAIPERWRKTVLDAPGPYPVRNLLELTEAVKTRPTQPPPRRPFR